MSQPNLFDDPQPQEQTAPIPTKLEQAISEELGIPPASEPETGPREIIPSGNKAKRVILVDGHALAYRSYFALSRGPQTLQTSQGEPVQAIYGFMKTLLRLIRDGASRKGAKDHSVIVMFDPPVKTFRHEAFEGYKAGRAETPSDLPKQIRTIKKLVDLMGLQRLEMPGYEADDVIGTLAARAEALGCEVRILTSDRDAYQLLSEKVRVISSDDKEVTPADVLAKYGVTVEQWVDYRALTGDSSDNIPGAKGIGPKGAQKLLEAYGSLDWILANLDQVKPEKEAQKIRDSLENVIFSKELSRIVTNIEMEAHFDTGFTPHVQELTTLLQELEFLSFIRELGLDAPPPKPVRVLETSEWVAPDAAAVWGFTLSAENPVSGEFTGLAFSNAGKTGESPSLDLEPFKGMHVINGADAKNLAVHAIARGLNLEPGDDPLLMAYVIDPNQNEPGKVAQKYLDEDWPKDAAGRADTGARLLEKLPALFTPELRDLYENLEKPVSKTLARMEARGIRIDTEFFKTLSASMLETIQKLEIEVCELAGETFNLNSRDQLETILYDKLQLASGKKTKLTGKRSTAVSALEPLRDEYPIVAKLLEYRELMKLRGTYLEPLPQMVSERTGRLHTTFSQQGTATGRVSSLNPNLQNIPVRTSIGREIRKGFIAAEGMKLISADYSQIELRILAHITQEPALLTGFRNNEDIHRRTAATILGLPLEAVTNDQRRGAKAINYGILYGMSAHRLSKDEGISHSEAKAFIEAYFAAYPGINGYLESTKNFCRENGYVQDLFHRRRYIPEVNSAAFPVREAAERAAINMPIQGTSAGIIKKAMIELEPRLEAFNAHLLLQVHDELVLEAPEDRVQEVSSLVEEVMGNAFELAVPLGVGVGVGDTWFDAH
jgi:DNA polymerase I